MHINNFLSQQRSSVRSGATVTEKTRDDGEEKPAVGAEQKPAEQEQLAADTPAAAETDNQQ